MSERANYDGLLAQLQKHKEWPSVFLFKFIIPNDNKKLALTQSLFGEEAQVTINKSRTGKYLSVSAKELMLNPESIIERYKSAGKIKGLIAL
ncbi:MAG: DUF493 domain-containing protein [Salibacteraceae bacterium]